MEKTYLIFGKTKEPCGVIYIKEEHIQAGQRTGTHFPGCLLPEKAGYFRKWRIRI